MQLTYCRLFRVTHTVGLQHIKKPFSLSAVEFGFSCSTNMRIYVHASMHMHGSFMYTYEARYRHRVRCSHALSTDPPLSAPSYATSRDRISICCAHMYITVRKSARIVPLDQQSVFDGSYSSPLVASRGIQPRIFFSFFFFSIYVSSSDCRIVLRVVTHRIEIYQSQINADRYKHFSRIPDRIVI